LFEPLKPALIITRREIRDQFRDWRIIIPIFFLTLIFPAIMNFTARQAISFVERYGAEIIGDRLIPFLLMVVGFFPISVSLVIALESFVGEKERRSIEPLLSSPLKNWHLYFGKLFAVMVPPLVASYLGIVVYLIGVYFQIGWKPESILLIQILMLTFVQALVMVSGAVVISTQATSVRAANLLASFIIIPMAFLVQGESLVMFWARYEALWWVIVGLIIVSGLLIRLGLSHFNREELLGRELDTLNIRWNIKLFFQNFTGEAKTIKSWYRFQVFPLVRKLVIPVGLMILMLVVALWIGYEQSKIFVLPSNVFDINNLQVDMFAGRTTFRLLDPEGIFLVWFHNFRVILLALAFGIFSFGVFGVLVLLLPLMLAGYFMGAISILGITPMAFLGAFILPHGILEIPAIILAGAGILYFGAKLLTRSEGFTIGEVFVISLSDWLKLMVGLVMPLLLGAAVIEVLVTPRIVLLLLQ